MVVNFVWQSRLLNVQIFTELRLQNEKAHISFYFLLVVIRFDFRSFCKTEMELNEIYSILLQAYSISLDPEDKYGPRNLNLMRA